MSVFSLGKPNNPLAGLDKLAIDSDGVLLVQSDGTALWFAEDGVGGYVRADGDLTFSTLEETLDGTFTLTDKHGQMSHFDPSGFLTAREDRNGNIVEFTCSGRLLTMIADALCR